MRHNFKYLLVILLLVALPVGREALADEVVLISGERFTSSRIWEENGKILFDMQGLIVSVSRADVADIVRGSGNSSPPAVPPGRTPQVREDASSPPSVQQPLEKPAGRDPSAT